MSLGGLCSDPARFLVVFRPWLASPEIVAFFTIIGVGALFCEALRSVDLDSPVTLYEHARGRYKQALEAYEIERQAEQQQKVRDALRKERDF